MKAKIFGRALEIRRKGQDAEARGEEEMNSQLDPVEELLPRLPRPVLRSSDESGKEFGESSLLVSVRIRIVDELVEVRFGHSEGL